MKLEQIHNKLALGQHLPFQYIVYSLPRSGSWALIDIITQYAQSHHISPEVLSFFISQSIDPHVMQSQITDIVATTQNLQTLLSGQDHYNYILKLEANNSYHFTDSSQSIWSNKLNLHALNSLKAPLLVLERKNRTEQLLSWCIAQFEGYFGESAQNNQQYTISEQMLAAIKVTLQDHQRILQSLKRPYLKLYYEDLFPSGVLAGVGHPRHHQFEDKKNLIKNFETVMEWLSDNQSLFPSTDQ